VHPGLMEILSTGGFVGLAARRRTAVSAAVELSTRSTTTRLSTLWARDVQAPPRISGWWWLLAAGRLPQERRRSRTHRDAMMRALTPAQREQMVGFMNKATAWVPRRGGAF